MTTPAHPDYAAELSYVAAAFERLNVELCKMGEAGGRLARAMERSINEELARFPPEQRERYHALVAAGAYKLDALIAAQKNNWPKGTPRKGKGKR